MVAAYNTRLALVQFGLVLLGIALYFLLANLPDPVRVGGQSRSVLAGLLAVVPLALSLYFLLTNDWSRSTGKLHVCSIPFWKCWQPVRSASIGLGLNPNSIGGAIAILLPLQVFALAACAAVARCRDRRNLAGGAALKRGARRLAGAGSGCFCLGSVDHHLGAVTDRRRTRAIWLILAVIGGLACVAAIALTPLGGWLLERSGDRVDIWRNSSASRAIIH